jgi:hypothetical protein
VRLLLDAGANKEASSYVREFRHVFSLQRFPMFSRLNDEHRGRGFFSETIVGSTVVVSLIYLRL